MSKKYKTSSYRALFGCYRHPRGYCNAKRAGARHRSLPPTAYDDKSFNSEWEIMWSVLNIWLDRDVVESTILRRMQRRFFLPRWVTLRMIRSRKADEKWMEWYQAKRGKFQVLPGLDLPLAGAAA